jgi:hypothetical protein
MFFLPTVETPLNIKIQRGNAVYFKRIKIDVFSAENISLYTVYRMVHSIKMPKKLLNDEWIENALILETRISFPNGILPTRKSPSNICTLQVCIN